MKQSCQSQPDLEPRVQAHDRFITLTDAFRHLGTIISSNLQDELEIRTRIKKAEIGALRAFFHCPHISTKLCVFIATPINATLQGCKMQRPLRVSATRASTRFSTKRCIRLKLKASQRKKHKHNSFTPQTSLMPSTTGN
jgi:hypothetical protein